jgi:hypothetical protein
MVCGPGVEGLGGVEACVLHRGAQDLRLAAHPHVRELTDMIEELAPRHLVDRGRLHGSTQALPTDIQIAQYLLSTRAFATRW